MEIKEMTDTALAKKLGKIEEVVRRWERRLSNIESSKRHYLKRRMKTRNKYDTEKARMVRQLEAVRRLLCQKHLSAGHANNEGVARTVLLLSQAERLKLLRLLNDDYRLAFRCTPKDARELRAFLQERGADGRGRRG